ncbi:MAG: STAS domain-containing protein [Alphaproteobacteria bacterium]|nr:STAS domain-containing protein [Alphaproteobacteria bacterium]
MEINQSVEGDKIIFSLSGRLVTANSEEARTTMLKAAEEANDLILDLEKLDFMASSGLRIILELAKRIKQKGGNFTVKKPKPVVLDVLEMTGLSSILNITQE